MASMTEITGNCIVAYQRYMYDVLKNTKMLDMIAFVDPAMVGERCGTTRSKAEHLCASQHWVLTIVEPEKEKVYYMDPQRRRLPIASADWNCSFNHFKRWIAIIIIEVCMHNPSLKWINAIMKRFTCNMK
ncbi:hypothetical protein ACLB2K_062779 [Fragaria x ananassa]